MSNEKKENKKKKHWWIILLILLFILFLIGFLFFMKKEPEIAKLPTVDTLVNVEPIDTIKEDTSIVETTVVEKRIDTIKVIKKTVVKDTVIKKTSDTLVPLDTLALFDEDTVEEIIDPCLEDTVKPWVYPDPSGGLHYGEVDVKLFCTKSAVIEWRFKNDKEWKAYRGRPIKITTSNSICYKAKDSCGNIMEMKCEEYEIGKKPDEKMCPKDMAHIKIGAKSFCIDRYEWPNIKGKKPSSNVSLYQAQDSCFTKGKRLCTTEEWSLSCGGAYNWKYAYGNRYEPNACNTRDTSVAKSGERPECRGYFEIFDMSGNLAEWTDTKSRKNSEFYNVMGGFWQSGPQSTCFDPRYSYFPQNHHNPVGFRCCKDAKE